MWLPNGKTWWTHLDKKERVVLIVDQLLRRYKNWAFYERMCFMKPYMYERRKSVVIPCRSSFNALLLSFARVPYSFNDNIE